MKTTQGTGQWVNMLADRDRFDEYLKMLQGLTGEDYVFRMVALVRLWSQVIT
jgi:hypothetical protein